MPKSFDPEPFDPDDRPIMDKLGEEILKQVRQMGERATLPSLPFAAGLVGPPRHYTDQQAIADLAVDLFTGPAEGNYKLLSDAVREAVLIWKEAGAEAALYVHALSQRGVRAGALLAVIRARPLDDDSFQIMALELDELERLFLE